LKTRLRFYLFGVQYLKFKPSNQPEVFMSNEPMSNDPMTDVTSDDKLWAALGYPIALVAIIVLFMEDKKNRPFIKFHAVQSIAANVVFFILSFILGVTVVGAICAPALWLVFLYWAYKAYQGEMFEIPVITNFIKGQGWI
jgi:uncharacterized membrane protein